MNKINSILGGGTTRTAQEELPERPGSFSCHLCAPRKGRPRKGSKRDQTRLNSLWSQRIPGNWDFRSRSGAGTAVTTSSRSPAQGFKAESSKIRVLPTPPAQAAGRGGEGGPRSREENSTRGRRRYASGWPLLVFLSSFLRFCDMK